MLENTKRIPLSVTEKAGNQIKELINASKKFALKLNLKKGGCAGMEYSMQYVDAPEENEEVFDFNGAKIIVAPMAQMFLFGTEIDYEEGLLSSGFIFNNPNVKEACGCGESIKFS